MQTNELREKYLDFFVSKGCVRRPSDVLVPREDKSVLFTPAGMNQFKNQFLGIGKLDFTRATTCQKCLRTGDIGNVGVTAYHHTFFEMLGNFSFGDYFKKEAVHWAWEFLTDKKWLGLEPGRLSVTVFLDDDEAFNIWHDEIGLPSDRIRRDNEYENFWPAGAPSDGPDGVCGPCSEIFFQPDEGKEVEIWNLVFTQFNRVGDPPDNLRPLPKKNIDTGMGLERTAAVLQGVRSNFEIDILKPLCEAAGEVVGVNYEFDAPEGRALRRIADHVRAVTFGIHENVTPGAKGAPYIIRLLLRRALLEGYLLGRKTPFLHELVPAVAAAMKAPYPELAETEDSVRNTIRQEESHFLDTIDRGIGKFERLAEKAKNDHGDVIPGDKAFDLHQTDGFIFELSQSLAADRGLSIDTEGFEAAKKKHEETSGRGSFDDSVMAAGPLDDLETTHGATEFLGYETTEAAGTVLGIITDKTAIEQAEAGNQKLFVVLDRTPFYATAGGQVGDIGVITAEGMTFEVIETTKQSGLIVHAGLIKSGTLRVNAKVTSTVNPDRRAGIQRAHSATHLLHHALRTVLSEKATQRGSRVDDDELRFDFSHGHAVTAEELEHIEDLVNERIAEGSPVEIDFMNIDEARKKGAMALFGEKYPDEVRVVSMGDFSRELCGGTHLKNTGQVGVCRVLREDSVAAGVRRISALTGKKALARIRETERLLSELQQQLRTPRPEELPTRVAAMQEELQETKRALSEQTRASMGDFAEDLWTQAETVGGVKVVGAVVPDADRDAMREVVDSLRAKSEPVAIVLGTAIEGKVALIAAITKDLIPRVKASDAVKAAAKVAGGGGGGRPDMAEAGGSKPDQLPAAIDEGIEFYRSALG